MQGDQIWLPISFVLPPLKLQGPEILISIRYWNPPTPTCFSFYVVAEQILVFKLAEHI